MSSSNTLTNPYEHIAQGNPDWLRLNADVSRSDVYLLRSIVPEYGAVQLLVQNYIKHLAEYVRINQLPACDPTARECFLNHVAITNADFTINFTGRSTSVANGQGPDRDDGRGVEGVRQEPAPTPDLAAVSGGEPPTTDAGQGKVGGKKRKNPR